MASLNPLTKELVFKIVFYGPGLGGKTTTLQYIHATTKPEHRGKMVSLATPMDRTLYFDFLPLRIPRVRGMGVRLQLFTVPGQVYYGATRKLVLTGADGVVFVADSQAGRQDANQESLEDLTSNLAEHNQELAEVPHTFHWNKRDLSDLVPIEELDKKYNAHGAPALGTVATRGEGVFEGLERIARLVVRAYEAELPTSGLPLETRRDSSDEIGIAEAIRGFAEAPAQAKVSGAPPPARTSAAPSGGLPSPARPSPSSPRFVPEPPTSTEEPAPVTPSPATRVPTGELEEEAKGTGVSGRTKPAPGPLFTFGELWGDADREGARDVEEALGTHDAPRALLACDALVARLLASAGGLAGNVDAPRDPALVALLLGVDGRRYLAFRASVRSARHGEHPSMREALEAYAFALEVRRAREAIGR